MSKLYVVATPIGNLSDISERALNVLKECDLILCEDTRHSLKLLNYYGIKKSLTSYHKFNEESKAPVIIQKLLTEDKEIALISDAGTPCISDPGHEVIRLAQENKIEVIGIPGPSALITALSISGLDIRNFLFHGFFPRETKERKEIVNKINAYDIKTHVFYESPKRLINSLKFLKQELQSFKVVVCSDLTKIHEKTYYGDVESVIQQLEHFINSDLGEYVFIIEKVDVKVVEEPTLSLEAMLVDEMIKNNITVKEAMNNISNQNKKINKKSLYQSSLNLKKLH